MRPNIHRLLANRRVHGASQWQIGVNSKPQPEQKQGDQHRFEPEDLSPGTEDKETRGENRSEIQERGMIREPGTSHQGPAPYTPDITTPLHRSKMISSTAMVVGTALY